MADFLVQTVDGDLDHDFAFHLIKAIKYQNWIHNEEKHTFRKADTINSSNTDEDYIPVGSLDEFVYEYMEERHNIDSDEIEPINIPNELKKDKFLKRDIEGRVYKSSVSPGAQTFVKSSTDYLGYSGIISNTEYIPEDRYLVSDVIEIQSEWRAFVYHQDILDLRNYRKDFRLFPNIEKIEEMVALYDTSPSAYTLDVAINEDGETVLVEVHPFVSCGLYGFYNYKKLPEMMIEGFNWMLEEAE